MHHFSRTFKKHLFDFFFYEIEASSRRARSMNTPLTSKPNFNIQARLAISYL